MIEQHRDIAKESSICDRDGKHALVVHQMHGVEDSLPVGQFGQFRINSDRGTTPSLNCEMIGAGPEVSGIKFTIRDGGTDPGDRSV